MHSNTSSEDQSTETSQSRRIVVSIIFVIVIGFGFFSIHSPQPWLLYGFVLTGLTLIVLALTLLLQIADRYYARHDKTSLNETSVGKSIVAFIRKNVNLLVHTLPNTVLTVSISKPMLHTKPSELNNPNMIIGGVEWRDSLRSAIANSHIEMNTPRYSETMWVQLATKQTNNLAKIENTLKRRSIEIRFNEVTNIVQYTFKEKWAAIDISLIGSAINIYYEQTRETPSVVLDIDEKPYVSSRMPTSKELNGLSYAQQIVVYSITNRQRDVLQQVFQPLDNTTLHIFPKREEAIRYLRGWINKETTGPYLHAIVELQRAISLIKGEPNRRPKIASNPQNPFLSLKTQDVDEALRVIQDIVIPWRRENVTIRSDFEIEKTEADMQVLRAKSEIELEQLRLTTEKLRLEVEEKKLDLHQKKLDLALSIIEKLAPRLNAQERQEYVTRMLKPLDTLTTSALELQHIEQVLDGSSE